MDGIHLFIVSGVLLEALAVIYVAINLLDLSRRVSVLTRAIERLAEVITR